MHHALQRFGFVIVAASIAFYGFTATALWNIPGTIVGSVAAVAGLLVLFGLLLRIGLLALGAVAAFIAVTEGVTAFGGVLLGVALLSLSLAIAHEQHLGPRERRMLQRVFRMR